MVTEDFDQIIKRLDSEEKTDIVCFLTVSSLMPKLLAL